MFEVFKYVDKFFTSLTNYLTYNDIFIIFVGLFLVSMIFVFISTSKSYETKLIKAIDKFNSYFIDNPHINEDNLVAFNQKMKAKFVPKQLRKSWQQFVLYREGKASQYMSFENCVSNPMKNSSYKRDTRLLGTLAGIFSACALILNCYYCYEASDLASILSRVLLCPIIILLLNLIVQIFFSVKHSAVVSDLFQNYQYFEVNIDKATETLPEYVDYEVLFDRNEIKKGIPILYSYLQKRAEEEQRELERVRLKNVEHEKFDFDDTGVEASLVLERAMQEAENYIAERKKYLQDTEQINSDMTQEDMNYREITKEYNRQMQVSKETFANFKTQLENASSTIEANYLKKQQQQELDRQRNLERDFDIATDRHKKVIEGFNAELDAVDRFIAESRKSLEDAMKSEFSTYSGKVYDAAKIVVEEREKQKFNELKNKIEQLEEDIVSKNKELDKVYSENQAMAEKLEQLGNVEPVVTGKKKSSKPNEEPPAPPVLQQELPVEGPVAETYEEQPVEYIEEQPVEYVAEDPVTENFENPVQEEINNGQEYVFAEDIENFDADELDDFVNDEAEQYSEEQYNEFGEAEPYDEAFDEGFYDEQEEQTDEFTEEPETEKVEDVSENISTEPTDDGIKEEKVVARRGRPRKVVDTTIQKEKKQRGRPRKVVEEKTETPKRGVGRPKKEAKQEVSVKKGPGRPRKEVAVKVTKTKGPGRPRKEEQPKVASKGPGRPKKETQAVKTVSAKKGPGRPKKVEAKVAEVKKSQNLSKRGRPRKEDVAVASKKAETIVDIDEYLKQIDHAIAQENAKLEETQKELAKDAKLRRKK